MSKVLRIDKEYDVKMPNDTEWTISPKEDETDNARANRTLLLEIQFLLKSYSYSQWRSQPDNLVPLCKSLFIASEIDSFHSQ